MPEDREPGCAVSSACVLAGDLEGEARAGGELPRLRKVHGAGDSERQPGDIEPVDVDRLELGDIVVVRVHDSTMLHLVKFIGVRRRQVGISGTSGPANGWTTLDRVYGICTRIGETPVLAAAAKANGSGKAGRS